MPAAAPPPRRLLMRSALRLALAACAGRSAAVLAGPLPGTYTAPFAAYPFTLGVASGCPEPDGVVLWTRLAPDPRAADGGLDPLPVEVRWELAEDEAFTRIVRIGGLVAAPERAHAVHIEVQGLQPDRWYWYRFFAGHGSNAATSPVGRTRTAPAPGAATERMLLAVASCQHYEHGFYGAWRHLADEAPDLILHLGDYIYENDARVDPVRRHWSPEPRTLAGYRSRWAQVKTDPDLQRAHACAPWLYTWDDHEVDNDYAGLQSRDLAADFVQRRAAAYLACFEHMPLRALAAPRGADMRLYGRWAFGDLAEFLMLDDRQYRSPQACPRPGRGGSNVVSDCEELSDPARTMLGSAQEAWLDDTLSRSRARWTVLGQQTLFAGFDLDPGPGTRYWTDGWSGYPAARDALVGAIVQRRVRNPLVLGGDVHAHYVCDVHERAGDDRSPVVATEFCTTSITSPGLPQAQIDRVLPGNRHVRLADATRRGYLSMTLEQRRCTARLRVVDDARDPGTGVATRAAFVVEDGLPGAHPA